MTLIEFYDKAKIENIAGALLLRADKLIFIGDNQKTITKSIPVYQNLLKKRNINTEVFSKTINKNNLSVIVEQLSLIVEENDDCIFDLTGGEDLYLVAIGILMEKYRDRIQCHRFNFKNSTITDCDADGNVAKTESFDISIEENILLYGGRITSDENSISFVFDDDLNYDVEKIWNISKEDQKRWNNASGTIGDILKLCNKASGLDVRFEKDLAESEIRRTGNYYGLNEYFLKRLEENELIHSLVLGDEISFCFKNESVKNVLSTPGKMLEIAVASKLSTLKDIDGKKLYNDVKVGVLIDWDNDESDGAQTLNEIDVLAMKDSIPVFISCKSGLFDANELYKLKTVASRFGDDYAKCVLVATSMERLKYNDRYIRSRADDMKIRIVDDFDTMEDAEINRVLKSLYCN